MAIGSAVSAGRNNRPTNSKCGITGIRGRIARMCSIAYALTATAIAVQRRCTVTATVVTSPT